MATTDLNIAKIYVGTYGKYNDGSIAGKWLDLSDYSDKDEFMKACAELHKDEYDPEFMFQDWEYIPDDLICESWLSDSFFDVRDAMDDLEDTEKEPFMTWCNHCSRNIAEEDINELISSFRDDYQGKYDDEEDYANEIITECYDLPEFALTYFDYEKFARDLFMCDYWFEDNYVFRNS